MLAAELSTGVRTMLRSLARASVLGSGTARCINRTRSRARARFGGFAIVARRLSSLELVHGRRRRIPVSLHSRDSIPNLQRRPDLQKHGSLVLYSFVAASGEGLESGLDLRIDNFVSGEAWKPIQDIQNLQDHVVILLPHGQLRVEDLVTVHPHYPISNTLILATLNPTKELDSNPFLLALHKGSHDFRYTIFVQGLGLDTVDIFLISLAQLLLARLLGHRSVPALCIVDAQSLDCGIGQLGRSLGLGPSSDEAHAVRFSAVAGLGIGAVSINIVIECELFTGFDGPFGEDSHPELLAHNPLVDIAVGIARVVAETAEVPPLGRIDELVFAERHEIEMFDTLFIVLSHAASKWTLGNDFAQVLEDELLRSQGGLSPKAIAFLFRLDNGDICIFSSLESLILTIWTTAAVAYAFDFGCAVDAV